MSIGWKSSLLVCSALLCMNTCYSATVYEQSWDGVISGELSQEFASTPSNIGELADSFLATESWLVNAVGWHGVYYHSIDMNITELDFVIRFYENVGGIPSLNPFSESIVTAQISPVGTSVTGVNGFSFSALLSVPVLMENNGTYWISIMDNNFSTQYGWSAANTGPDDSYAARPASSLVAPADWSIREFPYNSLDRTFSLVAETVAVSEVPILPSFVLMFSGFCALFGIGSRWHSGA